MVLEFRAPDKPAFSDLWPMWPTAISYAVSYLFIAIIWINHHYLMRFVGPPRLFEWLRSVDDRSRNQTALTTVANTCPARPPDRDVAGPCQLQSHYPLLFSALHKNSTGPAF